MKTFFKIVFGSMVGFLLSFFFLFLLAVMIASAGSGKKEVALKKNSVIHLKFNEEIPDRTSDNPLANFSFLDFSGSSPMGLNDILENIEKAAASEQVSGIFLDLSSLRTGFATVEEIRNVLLEFKKSGKFVYAYSEMYSQGAYYLATVADKIYVHPTGMAELKGLRSELMFFKGALEKLGLEPQVFRHGQFKSAVEPFVQDKMSDANRRQIRTFLFSFWNHMVEGIAKERNLPKEKVQEIADKLLVTSSVEAKDQGLVDELKYRDEVLELIREKTEAESITKIEFVSLSKLKDVKSTKERGSDKIAVVYAEGDIIDGKGKEGEVGSEEFSKAIRKARLDDKVKAVVLRINSPGGSALASETIWREVVITKKVKPVIVSMGNLAASGGYYIACQADTIVAQPNTITGSIGVFGLFFNTRPLLGKIGVSIDTVKTARYADILSPSRAVTPAESLIIQREIERIYDDFISRVAEGRNMTKAQVDSIAQGRVWAGADAKRLGLVDVLGGLETAIDIAARKAGLEKYRLMELPFRENPLEAVLKKLGGDTEDEVAQRVLGESYVYYRQLDRLMRMRAYQARIPYGIEIY